MSNSLANNAFHLLKKNEAENTMKKSFGGIIFLLFFISCNIENPSNGLPGKGTETLNGNQSRDWYPVHFITSDGKGIYGAYLDPPYFKKVYTVPSGYVLDNISGNAWELWVTGKITSNNYGFCGLVDYFNQTLTVKKTYYPYDSRQDVGVGGSIGTTNIHFARYHSSTKQYYRARQSNDYQWETIKTSLPKNAKRIDTRPYGDMSSVGFINTNDNYAYWNLSGENEIVPDWAGIQMVDVAAGINDCYFLRLYSNQVYVSDLQTRAAKGSYTLPFSKTATRLDVGNYTQVYLSQDGWTIYYIIEGSAYEFNIPAKMKDVTVDIDY
jgi:hypothetical protein